MKFQDVYIRSNVKSKQKEFNEQAAVINTAYVSFLDLFDTERIWRVTVGLVDNESLDYKVEDLKEVITVFRYLDFDSYWKKDTRTKKLIILDLLQESILYACEKFNLTKEPFELAYVKTKEDGIRYSTFWGKAITSPNGKFTGRIRLDFDFDISAIEAHIINKATNEVTKLNLTNPEPNYRFFDRCLGKAYWKSDSEFCLESKNGKNTWVARTQ